MLNTAAASSTVSIVTAVVGAIVAILGALGYQTRRARVSAIRTAFDQVTGSLASDDERQQLAAAVCCDASSTRRASWVPATCAADGAAPTPARR